MIPSLPLKMLLTLFAVALVARPALAENSKSLPDPDGKPADMSKPVQVFILMGQSNMLGFGKISGAEGSLEYAVKEKGLYPYLIDDNGAWTTRQDVRNVFVMDKRGRMSALNN